MSYCYLNEAWGNMPFKNDKSRKKKNMYKTTYDKSIYDLSFNDGLRDNNCEIPFDANFDIGNKDRFVHSRTQKNIYNKKKKRTRDKKNVKINPYSNLQEENLINEGYKNFNEYNMDLIEGFENNSLDNLTISENKLEKKKLNKYNNLLKNITEGDENKRANSDNEISDVEQSDIENSDNEISDIENSDIENSDNEIKTETENINKNISKNIKSTNDNKELDYKINNLNRNVNMIINQMNKSQFFDDESQDNIHDLILFFLFGIFVIFILDFIYRLGKNTSSY